MDKLYRHYRVLRAVEKSANMITQLYQTFARTPALLPPLYQERSKRYGVERTVADYIAGMTDRYAVLEFNRVLNPAFEICNLKAQKKISRFSRGEQAEIL